MYRVVLSDAADPDSAWAATGGGVYRWEQGRWVPSGLVGTAVYDLAVCEDGTVLAAAGESGLWQGGDSQGWVRLDPEGWGSVKRVALAPDCSARWVAEEGEGGDRLWVGAAAGGWNQVGRFSPVVRLIADPGGAVWIATQADGLHRWDPQAGTGPVSGLGASELMDLAAAAGRIAVAAGASGLWTSDDGGATWRREYDPDPDAFGSVERVCVDTGGRTLFWVGGLEPALVERRPDGSGAVLERPHPGWTPLTLACSPSGDWSGADKDGAFRREGRGFSERNEGLSAVWVSALAFDPTGGGRVAVGQGGPGTGPAGVFVWEPGRGWSRHPCPETAHVTWVGFRGGELWAALSGRGPVRWANGAPEARTGGIPVSEVKSPGPVLPIPGRPDGLVVSFLTAAYVSHTAGALWERAGGLPATAQRPWLLAWDPGTGRFWAAGQGILDENGKGLVYESSDGLTWSRRATLDGAITAIAPAGRDPDRMLLVAGPGGVRIRTPKGWEDASGLPAGAVAALAVDDRPGPARVAAAVTGAGIWLSEDGGQDWLELPSEGLVPDAGGTARVTALAFEPGTGRLVAGVEGRGLLYLDALEPLEVFGTVGVEAVDAGRAVLGLTSRAAGEVGVSLDGTTWNWNGFTDRLEVALPEGDGGLLVFVRFRAGNRESPTYQVLAERPDVTPPEPVVDGLSDAMPAGEPVVVTVSGDDVVEYRHALDGDPFPEAWTFSTIPLDLGTLSQGAHTLRIEVRDEAGNRTTVTLSFTVGTAAPEPPVGGTEPPPAGGGTGASPSGGGGGGGCFVRALGGRW